MIAEARIPLRKMLEQALSDYFIDLDDQASTNLYQLVIREVEIALLNTVLTRTKHNQSKAASILGLARGTLRQRIIAYALDEPTT